MQAFTKQYAKEFRIILEFIDTVANAIEADGKIKYKNQQLNAFDGEYGLYLWNKNKSLGIFFGLWMEYWEEKGSPVCIVLDCNNDYTQRDRQKFYQFMSSNSNFFLPVTLFQEYAVAPIANNIITEVGKEGAMGEKIKEAYHILQLNN